ncbi:hypothetical protein BOX15_Mlig009027g3 [Macrostomum lignano]|uniref:Uncharacterized protein n=1 Tax=Macrostomum lignano TaxID=282301 RepID=A0A267H727_9PLAT|nr:hypothetical protein BOX15_Mlig009027g3 [Macrostomum lignano]
MVKPLENSEKDCLASMETAESSAMIKSTWKSKKYEPIATKNLSTSLICPINKQQTKTTNALQKLHTSFEKNEATLPP